MWKTAIQSYLSMIKFSHSLFALPFAAIASVQALPQSPFWNGGDPKGPFYWLTFQIIVCMVTLRSAAMGFNRLVDRHFDAQNPRTAKRELPAGKITLSKARIFVLLSALLFLLTACTINYLTALLSPLVLGLLLFYSYTKRFTYLCHFFLGLAIGMAPLAAWIALLERIDMLPLLWAAGLAFYISAFDILYSCQDKDFDQKAGLFSLPQRFGVGKALWVARLCHLLALSSFWGAGYLSNLGALYFGAILLIAVLFLIEHVLVRPPHLEHIPIAFFHVNASISSLLFLAVLLDTVLSELYSLQL